MVRHSRGKKKKILIAASTDREADRLCCLFGDYLVSRTSVAELMSSFLAFHPDLVLLSRPPPLAPVPANEVRRLVRQMRAADGTRHTGLIYLGSSVRPAAANGLQVAGWLSLGFDDWVCRRAGEEELVARVANVLRVKNEADHLRRAVHGLSRAAKIDHLTGLYNMSGFQEGISHVFRAGKESGSEGARERRKDGAGIAIMMMDVDDFKRVNDTTDHMMGSYCLSEIGRRLAEWAVQRGRGDIFGRFGGDEFVGLLRASSLADTAALGEGLGRLVGGKPFQYEGHSLSLSVSLGLAFVAEPASTSGTWSHADVLKLADHLLYQSKILGKRQAKAEAFDPSSKKLPVPSGLPAVGHRDEPPS